MLGWSHDFESLFSEFFLSTKNQFWAELASENQGKKSWLGWVGILKIRVLQCPISPKPEIKARRYSSGFLYYKNMPILTQINSKISFRKAEPEARIESPIKLRPARPDYAHFWPILEPKTEKPWIGFFEFLNSVLHLLNREKERHRSLSRHTLGVTRLHSTRVRCSCFSSLNLLADFLGFGLPSAQLRLAINKTRYSRRCHFA